MERYVMLFQFLIVSITAWTFRQRLLLSAISLGSITLLLFGCGASVTESDSTHPEFIALSAKPAQDPITEPPIKRVAELDDSYYLRDDDLVLGVELNGDYRAYPLNQLTGPKQEVINDYLGDQPILVTW